MAAADSLFPKEGFFALPRPYAKLYLVDGAPLVAMAARNSRDGPRGQTVCLPHGVGPVDTGVLRLFVPRKLHPLGHTAATPAAVDSCLAPAWRAAFVVARDPAVACVLVVRLVRRPVASPVVACVPRNP